MDLGLPLAEEFQNHLILLAYYYLPDNTSGVQRAVRLAKYLPRNGFRCHVISSSHPAELTCIAGVAHVPNEQIGRSSAVWLGRVATFVQRFLPYNEQLPWVPHAIRAARNLMARTPVSAVLSTSPPLASHLAALWLKKRYGLKWVADFRDPLYGNPGRARRWARPYDKAIERQIFRNADAIISVTDTVAAGWRKKYPQWAHKIHVIWNGFDPEYPFGPAILPIREYKVISHVGVLYGLRHPTSLLASLDRLLRRGALNKGMLRIRFVGPVQQETEFLQNPAVASLMRAGCLEIQGRLIPRQQAMDEIATSDFLLLLDIANLSNIGYTVPAKLYDYILAGRPKIGRA